MSTKEHSQEDKHATQNILGLASAVSEGKLPTTDQASAAVAKLEQTGAMVEAEGQVKSVEGRKVGSLAEVGHELCCGSAKQPEKEKAVDGRGFSYNPLSRMTKEPQGTE